MAIKNRINAHRNMFSSLPATLADWHDAGFPGGSPQQLVDQLNAFAEAGIERFMLQHNDLDDTASFELLAADVMPYV